MATLGIVTGLASEADCLDIFSADPRLRVLCAGPGPTRAGEAARTLLSEGCSALVSFGFAGGLDPAMGAGALIVARAVVTADGRRLAAHRDWRRRLTAGLGGDPEAVEADVAGVDVPAFAAEDKRSLHETTGAAAVDMESHAIARAAIERGVRFIVVRAIADPRWRSIPAWVPQTVGPEGRPRLVRVAAGVLSHPRDTATLVRLAVDSRRALATLRRVAFRSGPLFFVGG